MNWPHAIATGVLISAIYWLAEQSGILEGKTRGKRLAIMAPIYFVAVLILNLAWPLEG